MSEFIETAHVRSQLGAHHQSQMGARDGCHCPRSIRVTAGGETADFETSSPGRPCRTFDDAAQVGGDLGVESLRRDGSDWEMDLIHFLPGLVLNWFGNYRRTGGGCPLGTYTLIDDTGSPNPAPSTATITALP